jgi:hypothetical protein
MKPVAAKKDPEDTWIADSADSDGSADSNLLAGRLFASESRKKLPYTPLGSAAAMGKWCEYDLLSGSDGGLRLALEFINAAAPDQYYSWDDDVQLYSELSPPDDDRSTGPAEDRSVVLGTVQFTDEFGRHTVFTTQTTEDTYQKIFKLIDAIPAVVWSSPTGFMHVMQFLNSPGVQDAKHGHRERAV